MGCTAAVLETVAALERQLALRLSPGRRRHSFAVAEMARKMCLDAGLDPGLGYLAGLAHDLAREMKTADCLRLAGGRRACSALELEYPVLTHGRAAATLLRTELGVKNADILQAVEDHVTGRPGMQTLSRIVFAADALEPGRETMTPGLHYRAGKLALDQQVLLVLERTFAWLRREKRPIAPASLELYKELTKHA